MLVSHQGFAQQNLQKVYRKVCRKSPLFDRENTVKVQGKTRDGGNAILRVAEENGVWR